MLSTGSYSDLTSATETANKMVKAYGHGGNSFIIKHTDNMIVSFHSESLLLTAEEKARKIIEKAEKDVDETIAEYRELLMELIDHLSINSQITETEIKEIIQKYDIQVKDKNNYYNIKERILEFKKATI